jgi:regulator of protease activity HflC (stomatin/prohibitin superfamily)
MFGIQFVKFEPGEYVVKYKKGKVTAQGEGLSFYYFAPTTSLVAVPVGSNDVPFIFNETTVDFQEISVQGQITYRISDPIKTSKLLNYTLDSRSRRYISEDPQKLPQRLVNAVQVITKSEIKKLALKEALRSSEIIEKKVQSSMTNDTMVLSLGIEILGVSFLAIKPLPETAKALEAEAREQILKESDQAIFLRRNFSIEQERIIKETELNTEIAVENKNREIKEKQMESEKMVQAKRQEMEDLDLIFSIQQEEKNKSLVELKTLNEKMSADAKAYAIMKLMQAYEGVNPAVLQTLANSGMDPDRLIALAFQGLADKAEKIGQLNISPDLLNELLHNRK